MEVPQELRLVLSVPAPSTASLSWQSTKFCGLVTVVSSGFCSVFQGLPQGEGKSYSTHIPSLGYDLNYGGLLVVGYQYFGEMAVKRHYED